MDFTEGVEYVVTDAQVAPHHFLPGTVVTFTGEKHDDPADGLDRWEFEDPRKGTRGLLAAEVEPA